MFLKQKFRAVDYVVEFKNIFATILGKVVTALKFNTINIISKSKVWWFCRFLPEKQSNVKLSLKLSLDIMNNDASNLLGKKTS